VDSVSLGSLGSIGSVVPVVSEVKVPVVLENIEIIIES